MSDTIIIYHKDCMDGLAAAAIAWMHRTGPAIYIPMQYGDPIPDLTDKDVYLLDFCFKKEELEEQLNKAKHITIIDHHKTAYENIKDVTHKHLVKIFDMYQSGAWLAWRWFAGELSPVPALIQYIQDRDLWQWKLTDSKEVSAYLWSFSWINMEPRKAFEEFAEALFGGSAYLNKARYGGADILRYMQSQVDLIASRWYPIEFTFPDGETYFGACCNSTNLMSEVGEALCFKQTRKDGQTLNAEFGVYWFQRADGSYQYGLRSRGDFDVSKIAKFFGGGGHKNAAGFESKVRVW